METKKILSIFSKPSIISIIADVNTGKSNLLYFLLESLKKEFKFNLYTYGLRNEIEGARCIYSVSELEEIRDSLIVLDEFNSLFNIEDRTQRKQIENSLRLINHNNNILVLCGTGDNFKKFIASKTDIFIFKKITYANLINGSTAKKVIKNYQGYESGSELLNLPVDECLIFDTHYEKLKIPYMKEYDSKLKNEPIFTKSMEKSGESVTKIVEPKIETSREIKVTKSS